MHIAYAINTLCMRVQIIVLQLLLVAVTVGASPFVYSFVYRYLKHD